MRILLEYFARSVKSTSAKLPKTGLSFLISREKNTP